MEEADLPSSKNVVLILEAVLTPEMDSLGGKIQIKPSSKPYFRTRLVISGELHSSPAHVFRRTISKKKKKLAEAEVFKL